MGTTSGSWCAALQSGSVFRSSFFCSNSPLPSTLFLSALLFVWCIPRMLLFIPMLLVTVPSAFMSHERDIFAYSVRNITACPSAALSTAVVVGVFYICYILRLASLKMCMKALFSLCLWGLFKKGPPKSELENPAQSPVIKRHGPKHRSCLTWLTSPAIKSLSKELIHLRAPSGLPEGIKQHTEAAVHVLADTWWY